MDSNFKCWKIADGSDVGEQAVLRLEEDVYALQDATADEVEAGTRCLATWYVERKYKTQVCGPDGRYYDMKSEMQELSFEELIFCSGECIGAYHDGLIFLFGDEKTHYREKYLGEMPISADQGISFYDYYYLHAR